MLGTCPAGPACEWPHPPFDPSGDWQPVPGRQKAVLWEGAPRYGATPPPLPHVPGQPQAQAGLGWSPLMSLPMGAAATAAAMQLAAAPPLPLVPAASSAAPAGAAGGEAESDEMLELLQVGRSAVLCMLCMLCCVVLPPWRPARSRWVGATWVAVLRSAAERRCRATALPSARNLAQRLPLPSPTSPLPPPPAPPAHPQQMGISAGPEEAPSWQPPPADLSSLITPGLRNETGEYNCFLNVIIQCLWRCADFRQQVSVGVRRRRCDGAPDGGQGKGRHQAAMPRHCRPALPCPALPCPALPCPAPPRGPQPLDCG